jgi:hypothetical protein
LAAVLSVALAGCVSRSGAPAAQAAGDDTRKDAASYARSTAKDVYRSLRRGKLDASQSLLSDQVFVVGPRAEDVYTGRTDAVLAVTAVIHAGDRHKLRSRGLVAEASVTGKSAWIVDRIEIDRRPHTVVAVLAEIDEIWYVVALHVASNKPSAVEAALPPLVGGVDDGATAVVELARAGAEAPELFLDQLSDHKKTTVLGPGRKDHLRGKRGIERKWKRKRSAPVPFGVVGEPRAAVTPDGGLAWVVANTRVGDADDAVPHRRMFVYERAGDSWRLVAMQDAGPFR